MIILIAKGQIAQSKIHSFHRHLLPTCKYLASFVVLKMHSILVICISRYRQKIIVNMINMNHKNMTIYVNLISKNLC